ncbi:S1/P1 nuclease [Bradyrhizobium sp. CB1650]|uniref:S1/P1 nuclease n=1 Tax=Bradyrhizobium sp. CB1650 TaxID=3039153 RepID=UPI002434F466|nr:S1/P1 nuclease [Bradyrhizobium sp. CB1650]WGD53504.1 S1/P1 nuclease [Bradyrhizobium sp. CB1650]
MRVLAVLFFVLMGLASPAHAWWDMGHMEVAAIAYGRLDDALRPKVDALIKQHPAYPLWIKGLEGLPDSDKAQAAFVHAATWADDIKGILSCKVSHAPGCYDYDKVTDGTAAQNIGTSDHIVHDYWHYYDIPFSPDGEKTDPAPVVNALTQIRLLKAALSDHKSTDDLKCYDLVWLLHLVGDAHQPLHAVSRFTHQLKGDQGGNAELVNVGGVHPSKLHFVWDGILGDRGTAAAAIGAASLLPAADPTLAKVDDPEVWFKESAALAQQYAYGTAVGPDKGPYDLDAAYLSKAKSVAESQVALAGQRLANLINAALK